METPMNNLLPKKIGFMIENKHQSTYLYYPIVFRQKYLILVILLK